MGRSKVAISLDESTLNRLDKLVQKQVFPNRSQAIQEAVVEKLARLLATYASAPALRRAGIYRVHFVRILRLIRAIPILPRAIGRTIDRFLFRICCVQILHAQFIADDAHQFS